MSAVEQNTSVPEEGTETKSTIQKKLKSGDCKLLENVDGKAEFWKCFNKVVFNNETEKETGFVCCTKCKTLMAYTYNKGSSHLSRHKCALVSRESNSSMLSFVTKKNKSLPNNVINECKEKCIRFVCQDIRPMDIVSGPGFKSLASYLIKVGSQFGQIDVDDLLPHPTTISRNLIKNSDTKREQLFTSIKPFLIDNIVSATTDMWTDNYKKRSYVALTLHFIDNWKLKNYCVYTGQFPVDEKKTGENIKKCLKNFFVAWDMIPGEVNPLSKVIWVTDQGSNIKKALEQNTRVNCAAHMISNILKTTFDNKFISGEDGRSVTVPIFKLIQAAKALVGYMKRTGDNNKISKTLIQELEIRWNTRLLMLMSIEEQFQEIEELYKDEPHRFYDIDLILLKKIIDFLKPFKHATDELEGDTYPTIHKVILHKAKLEKHLTSYLQVTTTNGYNITINNNNEGTEINYSVILNALAKHALNVVEEKYKIHQVHEFACFLWPKFKSLRMLPNESKIRITSEVGEALLKYELIRINALEGADTYHRTESNNEEFEEWEDNLSQSIPLSSLQEVQEYLSDISAKIDDVLLWWEQNSLRFPLLSQLAKKILGIPASSASSERCFSTAGRIIEKRRTNLKGGTVDSLMFLHDDYKKQHLASGCLTD